MRLARRRKHITTLRAHSFLSDKIRFSNTRELFIEMCCQIDSLQIPNRSSSVAVSG